MMLLMIGLALLFVGVIASLALNNWWILVVVMGLHSAASAVVIAFGFKAAAQNEDKPDPVVQARMDDDNDEPDLPTPGGNDGPRDREVFS